MPKRRLVAVVFRFCQARTGKSSAADGRKFDRSYVQAIGAGRAECSSTRHVSNTSEWSQVSLSADANDMLSEVGSNLLMTRSSAVTERPRDASCLSV